MSDVFRSDIFKSVKDLPAPQGASREPVTFFRVKDDQTPDAELSRKGRNIMAMMLVRAINEDGTTDVDTILSYILTVMDLMAPGFASTVVQSAGLSPTIHTIDVVPSELAKDVRQMVMSQETESDDHEPAEDSNTSEEESEEVAVDLGLVEGSISASMWKVTPEVVGGRLGIEMFPIGKNVSNENIVGYRVNRVDALKGRYKFSEDQTDLLRGPYSPTLPVLTAIQTVFNIFGSVRHACAVEWISWISSNTSRECQAFVQTFKLTDGSGLGGPGFVADLLTAYPELSEFPELAPEVAKFRSAITQFARTSPGLRGFVKVIYGDKHVLFSSVSRSKLLSVAIQFAKQSDSRINNFLDTSGTESMMGRINDFVVSKGRPAITGGVTPTPQKAPKEVD